ncbi:hypothetical protein ACFL09_04005, partial [Planctomycetota bacterium]
MRPDHACLDDHLEELEPPYLSRGEVQVGRLLDRYGIPFFYEYPVLVLDRGRHRVWHPDFVLPSYGGLIVEYAGMPDVPEYMAGIRYKERVFRENGVPALFLYPWDLREDSWEAKVLARIGS